mgnify:CR=1 FL=1
MPRKTKQMKSQPELLNQVNPDNVRLKQDFIAYLQSVQRQVPKSYCWINSNDIRYFWGVEFAEQREQVFP